ncbi:NADP-dependent oxidoreductase [Actinosynnema sp. NPDC051121]
MATGLEVRLASPLHGLPEPGNFEVVEVTVPDPGPGEVGVRNRYFVLEPGARLAMEALSAGVPGFDVDGLRAHTVGEVVASGSPDFRVGDTVTHVLGWREHTVADAGRFTRVDPDALPTLTAHLSGALTAHVGLVEIGRMRPGDAVFVSSAAGTVGSLAGQIARLMGAGRVVGSAGSAAKVRYLLDELGFDAAFDHHDGALVDRLREAAPDGIDVYFDNVGGSHLEAALEVMNPHGRVVLCGALSRQGSDHVPPGPANLLQAIAKRLTLRGFTVNEHLAGAADFTRRFGGWLRSGEIRYRETVVDGIEHAPRAFTDLLAGRYSGRVLVRVGDE